MKWTSKGCSQPRPQGFSLKKWVGRPTHFLREKPWGRGWDVVPKSVMTSLTCRTHVLLIKPVDCLLWRSLCLTKVPKNVMACRTNVFLIKQIACLLVCFLTFSSCCTFARVVTMVTSLQCCLWAEGYGVQRVFSPNPEPNIPLISVIFFQSFEREYIQKFWKLM